ncbi:MAG: protein kinase [Oscillospiraceae bacterium]|nr:protein kinase [Oscillospiraceae bacterium]
MTYSKVCPVCGALPPSVPVHHLSPGTVLKERYLVGRAVEETGRTITYPARDLAEDRIVTVQEYFPAGRGARDHRSSSVISGMEREQQALKRLKEKANILRRFKDEPGVITVSEVLEENDTVYLVTERPGGVSLHTFLSKMGRIGTQTLLTGMTPMLQTLQKLHDNGLIHRRISPETVRLYPDGSVKLVGFGVAGESLQKFGLKHGYAPKEQYELRDRSEPRSDIYSLCATIYAAITGNVLPAANERSSGDVIVEPSRYGAQIEPKQEKALLQGLETEAYLRPASVRDLMLALGLEAAPVPVAEVPVMEAPVTEEPQQPEHITEPQEASETPAAVPVEAVPAEPEQTPADREQERAERKGFSWKELLALAKIGEDEEEKAWDDFIETTLEKPAEDPAPADPMFSLGKTEPAHVTEVAAEEEAPAPAEPIEIVIPEIHIPDPVEMESAEELAPETLPEVDMEEPSAMMDKRLLGRRIAMGLMALIAVIGLVCAIWTAKPSAAEPEACAIVSEI